MPKKIIPEDTLNDVIEMLEAFHEEFDDSGTYNALGWMYKLRDTCDAMAREIVRQRNHLFPRPSASKFKKHTLRSVKKEYGLYGKGK